MRPMRSVRINAAMLCSPGNDVGGCCLAKRPFGRREASMAGKDKGGRSAKTPASKTAKEKRQAKKEKKGGKSTALGS